MQKAKHTHNTQIADKLSAVLARSESKNSNHPRGRNYFNKNVDVQSWKADGVDHINIWQAAETSLGKFLCHDTPFIFNHSILGKFNTVLGFWCYIQSETHDDRFRRIYGEVLRNAQRSLSPVRVTNFRAILMDACWQRLKQSESAMLSMKESTLPFDCYYIPRASNLRVRPHFHSWITAATEEMRKALKENREPNFDYLVDDKSIPFYDPITPQYIKQAEVEAAEAKVKPEVTELQRFKQSVNTFAQKHYIHNIIIGIAPVDEKTQIEFDRLTGLVATHGGEYMKHWEKFVAKQKERMQAKIFQVDTVQPAAEEVAAVEEVAQ